MLPELVETGNAPVVLYMLAVALLCLCLVFSASSILISIYNSVSNPYETYMGPVGVYVCSSLSSMSHTRQDIRNLTGFFFFYLNFNMSLNAIASLKSDGELAKIG